MIKYSQLTPEILLEYIYSGDPKLKENGNNGNVKDMYNTSPTIMLSSEVFSSKYMCFKNESERFNNISNLVLPLNNAETQFVVAHSEYQNFFNVYNSLNRYLTDSGSKSIYEDINYDKNINDSCDVKYDKCVIHFTSRNYFGNYDSLIFQTYVYMSNKQKLYLASFLFKRTSDTDITPEQLLYNGKLYTTKIEFDIPSVSAIFTNDNDEDFIKALKDAKIRLLDNTPICVNVYGVSETTKGIVDNYVRLKTLKISSISIPYTYNRFDEISVDISEANDGDYFYIEPKMNSNYSSIVDYIQSIGDNIGAYMFMHELSLRESWVENGETVFGTTHKEYHIIDINENAENEYEEISKKFTEKIKYRPICMRSGEGHSAEIIDTIKIINTVDNSSYEVKGEHLIKNPNKYGKKINMLPLDNKDNPRPIVNVYNKNIVSGNNSSNGYTSNTISISGSNSNSNTGGGIVVNNGGGIVIENMTQNITSFIECTNIGVSIVEISPDVIN